MRQGQPSRQRAIKGGRKPGRRPGYFERLRLVLEDNRRQVPLKSLTRIQAGGRRSESRAGSLLRRKKRKRSRLLRKT